VVYYDWRCRRRQKQCGVHAATWSRFCGHAVEGRACWLLAWFRLARTVIIALHRAGDLQLKGAQRSAVNWCQRYRLLPAAVNLSVHRTAGERPRFINWSCNSTECRLYCACRVSDVSASANCFTSLKRSDNWSQPGHCCCAEYRYINQWQWLMSSVCCACFHRLAFCLVWRSFYRQNVERVTDTARYDRTKTTDGCTIFELGRNVALIKAHNSPWYELAIKTWKVKVMRSLRHWHCKCLHTKSLTA